jgi:hypothetical protein
MGTSQIRTVLSSPPLAKGADYLVLKGANRVRFAGVTSKGLTHRLASQWVPHRTHAPDVSLPLAANKVRPSDIGSARRQVVFAPRQRTRLSMVRAGISSALLPGHPRASTVTPSSRDFPAVAGRTRHSPPAARALDAAELGSRGGTARRRRPTTSITKLARFLPWIRHQGLECGHRALGHGMDVRNEGGWLGVVGDAGADLGVPGERHAVGDPDGE